MGAIIALPIMEAITTLITIMAMGTGATSLTTEEGEIQHMWLEGIALGIDLIGITEVEIRIRDLLQKQIEEDKQVATEVILQDLITA
jgi:hypothetical protein